MAKKRRKNYKVTPTGAIGKNTAAAMQGLAAGTWTAQNGQAVPIPAQPLDPAVASAQVAANRNVAVGDLYGTWQQGNLDQDYGFGAGGAANPYSRAALLQESFRRSQRGTTNSYASQGQLYSGAYNRMQNENQRNYDIGYDQRRRDYDRQSGDIGFGRLENYANAGTGVDETKFNALLRALGGL